MVAEYQAAKRRRFERGALEPRDYSPCLYCVRYFEETAPLQVVRPMVVASAGEDQESACHKAR